MLARRLIATVFAGACAAGTVLLLRFPPTQYGFYPVCPIHEYFHMLCPGCGATRALAALLHGYLDQAIHWNALFVALLPFLAGYMAICCYRAMGEREFRWPQPPRDAVIATFVAMAVFTVARNLWT